MRTLLQSRLAPVWMAALLASLAVATGWLWGDDVLGQWQLAARYTARVGLPVFLIAYAASSLVRLWPGEVTKALLRHRRQWGLGFTLTHSVHLVVLTGYILLSGHPPTAATLAGGGGAYVMLYLMALTSNDASQRKLGIWWKRLHRLGIHWLWFIFAFSYFGRIMTPEKRLEGVILFGLCLVALGLRIWAWRTSRSVRRGNLYG